MNSLLLDHPAEDQTQRTTIGIFAKPAKRLVLPKETSLASYTKEVIGRGIDPDPLA